MKKLIPILLVLLTGCCGLQAHYVAADKATYKALAPEYKDYVGADADLTEEQKARRVRLLESWKARIEEGEKKLAEEE